MDRIGESMSSMNKSTLTLSGFTDEASNDLDRQIQVTQELGWSHLSARTIGERNIHDISDKKFDLVCQKLDDANIQVAEFGTLIGSWGKTIHSDWQLTLDEVDRAIPRMKKLKVRFARIMSYAQEPWGEDQHEKERFRRLNEIVKRFEDAGLEALHENCMNWGGFSADHTLRLLEEVPGMRLIFDTGNPISQRDRSKTKPYPWQQPFEFYTKVKHAIAHIHIKDAIMHSKEGEPEYVFAGEGDGQLDLIFRDLVQTDFKGIVAIEPHIGKVFHLKNSKIDVDKAYKVYLEYGQRFEQFLNSIT